MPRFSANLGFLWQELELPGRIAAAAAAGFSAVECHFPYQHPADEIAAVLADHGVQMISINTELGANGQEDFGVAAQMGREDEARALLDQAIDYAAAIGAANVNVVPGKTRRRPGTQAVLRRNLEYGAGRAAGVGVTLLLEPLSSKMVPDAHLSLVEHATEAIADVGADNVKVLFDFFHVQSMQGNIAERLEDHLGEVGHIQIAAVPDRGAPDHGELHYPWLFSELDRLGYDGWVGAEYHPTGSTEASLDWFQPYRSDVGSSS